MKSVLEVAMAEQLLEQGYLGVHINIKTWNAIQAAVQAALSFFRTSPAEKNLSMLSEDCGYRPPGIEYSRNPQHPDPIESFTASHRTATEADQLRSAHAKVLHQRLVEVFNALLPLVEELTVLMARKTATSDARHSFSGKFDRWSCVQVNYSQPTSTNQEHIHEVHEDGHLWTVAYATAPGLEVVSHTEGNKYFTTNNQEVIIMPGRLAYLMSGGVIKPLYHCVRANRLYSERVALLFFVDLDPKHCKPWLLNSINDGVDIGEKVFSNAERFGLEGFSAD